MKTEHQRLHPAGFSGWSSLKTWRETRATSLLPKMKLLLLLLGLALGGSLLTAATVVDTVVVSPEEILARKIPLTCEVQRRKDGSVSLKLSVDESSGAKGYFKGFDLRVLKKPIPAPEIKERVLHEELLAWHRPSSRRIDLFVLTEDEIPKSYIIVSWSLGLDPSGRSQVKNLCFSVQAMVDEALERTTPAAAPLPPRGRGSP
jgi:hypothetical protein